MMKHRVTWLSVIPLAVAMVNLAEAGFRCGGCSDPCRSVHSASAGCGQAISVNRMGTMDGCSTGSHSSHYSLVQAGPGSCGTVAADGSYAMSYSAPTMAVNAQSMSFPTAVQAPCQSNSIAAAPQIVCEPVTGYRTVMESTFVMETQYVPSMETKQETRTRIKKVFKTVTVTVDDYRTKTVMVPTNETKTIEYSVLIPEQSTKTVDVQVTVPVWNEVSENYTVKVPTISDVQESYNVNVARLKDESFTYDVSVPQVEKVTKMQTVTNAVPVVKTRTVQRTVPSYSTQSVTKDYGHWETVVEEVAGSCYGAAQVALAPAMSYAMPTTGCSNGCGNASMATTVVSGGGCGNAMFSGSQACGSPCQKSSCGCVSPCSTSCGSTTGSACGGNAIVGGNVVCGGTTVNGCAQSVAAAPATRTASRRVWIPSVVTEEVSVVTNTFKNEDVSYTIYEQQSTEVPYECAYVTYRSEQRTGTKKVVEYVPEPRTRTRKVVNYNDEQRTRTRRVLSYKTETKQESYPFVTYRTEKRTKDISFTVNIPTQTVEPFQTTRYETVAEDVVEEYTVSVQVPTTKEVQVQVCKMVPKLVAYTFNPCANASVSGSQTGAGCGCGNPAPVASPSANCGCASAAISNCNCGK